MPILPRNPYWEWFDEDIDGTMGVVYSLEGSRQYTRRFKVKVKLQEMAAVAVALCPGLPLPGSFYIIQSKTGQIIEYDKLSICTEIRAERQDQGDWGVWLLTYTYNTKFNTRTGENVGPGISNPLAAAAASDNPTVELADVFWDTETVRESRQYDLNMQPYLNSAFQPFSPPPTFEVDYPVLNITRNELNFNYVRSQQFTRVLNDNTFLAAPPGCVMSMAPRSVQKNKGTFRYWSTTYRLRFRALQLDGTYFLPQLNAILPDYDLDEDGNWVFVGYGNYPNLTNLVDSWQPLVLNKGMFRLGGSRPGDLPGVKGLPVPIFKYGQQVHHDVMLNQLGDESKPTDPNDVTTTPIWWKQFTNYRLADFDDLLLRGVG